ncbi:reverse transcriptase [Tanacetum coccineum]
MSNQMSQSVQTLTVKIATVETGLTYLRNEVARFRSGEGSSRQYSRMTKLEFPKSHGKMLRDGCLDANNSLNLIIFGPCYEDPMEEIKNLRQDGIVPNYQDKFEALVSRVELTESQAISCFMAGLQQDIRLIVKMFRPKSFYDSYQLARMHKTVKAVNTKRYTQILSTPKHLYVPGHKCSGQLFSLKVLAEQEIQDTIQEVEEQVNEEVVEEPVVYPQISLNSVAGVNTFHTMRIKGRVGKRDIHILVDSCSTHNFMDVHCAKKLGCEIRSICPLQVEVPGGNQMMSTTPCINFAWTLQENTHSQPSNKTHTALDKLLEEFQDVFDVPNTLPSHRTHDHMIILQEGVSLVNGRPYKHPPTQKDAMELIVKELLESRVIKNSHSPFSSLIVMVKKKDETWRMCINYRQLNKHTIKDKIPIPLSKELIDELSGAHVFSKLYLRSWYHQIRMADEDVHKTPFRTRMATDPSKIEAMKIWLVPRNIKELRGFLGLTGYYIRFIKGFATISHPLTSLLKKNAFKWSNSAQKAFEKQKHATIQTPVLALSNFDDVFVVETDASRVGLAAVLQQGGHPISYLSKTLAPKHQSLSTYEKEFMAVVLA